MTSLMSVKGCSALISMTVFASVLTSGNSLVRVHEERSYTLNARSEMTGSFPARNPEGSMVFRSTLLATNDNTVIRLENNGSSSVDLSSGPANLASLPESGSGILLGLGFLIGVPLAGRHGTPLSKP